MKRALVTGSTGQNGSSLSELLLEKGYEVHGIKRGSGSFNTGRIDPICSHWHKKDCHPFPHLGDLSDSASLWHRMSFDVPESTCDIRINGALRVLEAIRHIGLKTPFYQASSSEMFGSAPAPQNETTAFRPCSGSA